ncbi:MAG: GtrA family protein [Clostridia bacterium]|nr:GtrA family protein [Clostridia bacterium]
MEKLKKWLNQLESSSLAPLVQFIKFGIVGVSNTAISYGIEMLCYYVLFRNAEFPATAGFLQRLGIPAEGEQVKVVVVSVIALVISAMNAFYWNSRYVFETGEKRTAGWVIRTYVKTLASYALTGLVIAPALKVWLSGWMPYYLASLATLIVTIPVNFVINKFWAYASPGKKQKEAQA